MGSVVSIDLSGGLQPATTVSAEAQDGLADRQEVDRRLREAGRILAIGAIRAALTQSRKSPTGQSDRPNEGGDAA